MIKGGGAEEEEEDIFGNAMEVEDLVLSDEEEGAPPLFAPFCRFCVFFFPISYILSVFK